MEKVREDFIDLLIQYRPLKMHDITVVFDGHKSGAGTESVAVRGGVRIIYSKLGERADDVIKRIVSKDRREWIVVTSDRDIANHAWAVNSIPVPSDKFYAAISKQVRKKGEDIEPAGKEHVEVPGGMGFDDDEDFTYQQRGSSRQLSKKEKSVKRALSKL